MTKEDLRNRYEIIYSETSDTPRGKLKQSYTKWLESELIKALTLTSVVVSEAELCGYCEKEPIDTNTDYCKGCIDHVMLGGR